MGNYRTFKQAEKLLVTNAALPEGSPEKLRLKDRLELVKIMHKEKRIPAPKKERGGRVNKKPTTNYVSPERLAEIRAIGTPKPVAPTASEIAAAKFLDSLKQNTEENSNPDETSRD